MAKHSYIFFLLTFFLPLSVYSRMEAVETSEDSAKKVPQGFYVKGNVLGITENTVLSVKGDAFFDHAIVTGKGILELKDNNSIKIVSVKSSIQNLEIDNAQTVSLFGELTITQNLNLKQGVFDLEQGQLFTTDSTMISVFGNGKIINDLIKIRVFNLPNSNANNPQKYLSESPFLGIENPVFESSFLVENNKNRAVKNDERNFQYKPKIDIPPEIKFS